MALWVAAWSVIQLEFDDRDVSPNQLPFPAIGSIGGALPWLELNQQTGAAVSDDIAL